MDRIPRPPTPTPALLEVLEAGGLRFDLTELEELILAVDDRLEYGSADSRVVLRKVRNDLNLELGRLVALI